MARSPSVSPKRSNSAPKYRQSGRSERNDAREHIYHERNHNDATRGRYSPSPDRDHRRDYGRDYDGDFGRDYGGDYVRQPSRPIMVSLVEPETLLAPPEPPPRPAYAGSESFVYYADTAAASRDDAYDRIMGTSCVRTKHSKLRHSKNTLRIVIGTFHGPYSVPDERWLAVFQPSLIFWTMWIEIVKLRGLRYFFSLKEVTGFRVYRCPAGCIHRHDPVISSREDQGPLTELFRAYSSWSLNADEVWTRWFKKVFNAPKPDPREDSRRGRFSHARDDYITKNSDKPRNISLEVVFGWSPVRIGIVVLGPVTLSLGLGLWFQWNNPTDLSTIQAAWGIASYVATAGGFLAALLAILSGINPSAVRAEDAIPMTSTS